MSINFERHYAAKTGKLDKLLKAVKSNSYSTVRRILPTLKPCDVVMLKGTPIWVSLLFNPEVVIDLKMFIALTANVDLKHKIEDMNIFHVLTITSSRKFSASIASYVMNTFDAKTILQLLGDKLDGMLPIQCCANSGGIELFKLYYATTPKELFTNHLLLDHAIYSNNIPVCNWLLETYPDASSVVNTKSKTPFMQVLTTPREKYSIGTGVDDHGFNHQVAMLMLLHNSEFCLNTADADGVTGLEYIADIKNLADCTKPCCRGTKITEILGWVCEKAHVDAIVRATERAIGNSNFVFVLAIISHIPREHLSRLRKRTVIMRNLSEFRNTRSSEEIILHSECEIADETICLLLHRCDCCKKPPTQYHAIRRCKCHNAVYCGGECASADWKIHRETCSCRSKSTRSDNRRCGECGARCNLRCLCKKTFYCNDACARADWSNHKAICTANSQQ